MFSIYAFITPHILTKTGFILVVLCALYILYILKKSKDKVPDQFSMTYLEYLQETKEYLEYSKGKRETVLIWYVLPIVASIWIAMLGIYLGEPDTLNILFTTVAVSVAASIAIHYLNKRSAKKLVEPKLEKVKKLIASLKE